MLLLKQVESIHNGFPPKPKHNEHDTDELKTLWLKGKWEKTEQRRRVEPVFLLGPAEWQVQPPEENLSGPLSDFLLL